MMNRDKPTCRYIARRGRYEPFLARRENRFVDGPTQINRAIPAATLVFGKILPLNVLLTFAVAAGCIWGLERRQWALVALLGAIAPVALD